ncbi:DUF6544 family protein [Culicoidibacter larvae]|uniref:Uncharacterized protein n=1 Tax=Culicoidibacter larvae TaxID=2579976 RepID=A0A5R8Q9E1_9FIRM|nr:DUF6544 family protein [Culicoidibacter larvae]TLG72520.1 hypothetical protein FEZ08_09025 [Culicoidibacter larvae]
MKKIKICGVKMILLIGIIGTVALLAYILIFPYSPVVGEYHQLQTEAERKLTPKNDKITVSDLQRLPNLFQEYYIANGYIGQPFINHFEISASQAYFKLGSDKPEISINYYVDDYLGSTVERLAFIDGRLFLMPFQGIDSYIDGQGGMKGIVAKHIQLFNERSDAMSEAALLTYLSEIFIHPAFLLQETIAFKELDDYSVQVSIRDSGQTVSGVYYFNNAKQITSFSVEERYCDETKSYESWEAIFDNYQLSNGVSLPKMMQAVWHFKTGDLLYFDSDDIVVNW